MCGDERETDKTDTKAPTWVLFSGGGEHKRVGGVRHTRTDGKEREQASWPCLLTGNARVSGKDVPTCAQVRTGARSPGGVWELWFPKE